MDVSAVRITGGGSPVDLTPTLRFVAPDDGNADDQTVLEARLPQPAAPGSTLTIEVVWTARVPRPVAPPGTGDRSVSWGST